MVAGPGHPMGTIGLKNNLRMPRQQPGRENENEMNIIKNKI
jgi:hypothetical protein